MATATKTKRTNSDKVIELLEEMSVLELADLVKLLEERFGISGSMPFFQVPQGVSAPGTAPVAPAPVEEKTEFSLVLTGYGDKKIQVIKEVRAVTDLGLKEAKDLVEGVPKTIKEGISKEEAEKIRAKLVEAGGTVEIK